MKPARTFTGLLTLTSLAVVMMTLSACQTDQAGINATPTGAYANVDGSPQEITPIAKSTLKEMHLSPSDSTSTAEMGEVIGKTDTGSRVTVSIDKYTKNTSTVTVSIGGLFEQAPQLATKVVNKIQEKANQSG